MKSIICIVSAMILPGAIISAYAQPDSFAVFFAPNKSQPDVRQKAVLDSFLETGKLQKAPSIIIMGYGDKIGGDSVNMKISQLRAKGILEYLVSKDIPKEKILFCRGCGIRNPNDGNDTAATDRRVNILLMRAALDKNIADILSKLEVGQTLVLKNINFTNGTHHLELSSYDDLEQLYMIMLLYPALKIRVEGHVCCWVTPPGDDDDRTSYEDPLAYGQSTLSVNRARYICNYLVSKGIEKTRLSYAGFGNTRPLINPEHSDADRKQNRRVEIRVVAK